MLCADCVSRGGILLDIGSDHAYLPCYLAGSGLISHAYAADIADGPVHAAKKTVRENGLEDLVDVIRSDGLKDIPDGVLSSVTDISIAGMGGELIAKILSLQDRLPENVRLILQPNTRAHILRGFLSGSGFEIVSEQAVSEGKFIYTVISARRGKDIRHDPAYLYAGKLDPKDVTAREYINRVIKRLENAAEGMKMSSDGGSLTAAEENIKLANELKIYINKEI